MPRLLHAALFFLAIPAFAPWLAVWTIFGRRPRILADALVWADRGRFGPVAPALCGVVEILLGYRSGLTLAWLIPLAATVAYGMLFWHQAVRGRLDHGVFLGYQNLVVFTVVAGTTMAVIGALWALPVAELMRASTLYESPMRVSGAAIVEGLVARSRHISIDRSALRSAEALYFTPDGFQETPPTAGAPIERWTPIDNTHRRVWVVEGVIEDGRSEGGEVLSGFWGDAPRDRTLPAAAVESAERLPNTPECMTPLCVVRVSTPREELVRTGAAARIEDGYDPRGYLLLAAALLVLIAATWLAVFYDDVLEQVPSVVIARPLSFTPAPQAKPYVALPSFGHDVKEAPGMPKLDGASLAPPTVLAPRAPSAEAGAAPLRWTDLGSWTHAGVDYRAYWDDAEVRLIVTSEAAGEPSRAIDCHPDAVTMSAIIQTGLPTAIQEEVRRRTEPDRR